MPTKEFNVVTYFKLKISFDVSTGILRSQHINKLNKDEQGRDRIFHIATKIPTQGREVLSLHNRTGSRHKDELKAKSLVATKTSTTPIDYVATSSCNKKSS